MNPSPKLAWVRRLETIVARQLDGESTGHDPWHAFRVRDLALRIAAATGADRDIVEAAALLHDLGHTAGRDSHAKHGAGLAAGILSSAGFPRRKIPAVASCIEHHHWKPGRAGDPGQPTPEFQAFADADRLDALGAIGIARAFAFGGAHHRPIWDPRPDAPTGNPYGISSLHHFHEKLLRLPAGMYTQPARRLARKRAALMRTFLKQFEEEWKGDDGPKPSQR